MGDECLEGSWRRGDDGFGWDARRSGSRIMIDVSTYLRPLLANGRWRPMANGGQWTMLPIMRQSAMIANWLSDESDDHVSNPKVVLRFREENQSPNDSQHWWVSYAHDEGGVTEISQQSREPTSQQKSGDFRIRNFRVVITYFLFLKKYMS
jgi:hypothetical protein